MFTLVSFFIEKKNSSYNWLIRPACIQRTKRQENQPGKWKHTKVENLQISTALCLQGLFLGLINGNYTTKCWA